MLKQSQKENFLRWDLKLENLDRRPTRYYCHHQALCKTKVLRRSLSKYESRLYDVTFGPLVFEIRRPAFGQQVILLTYIRDFLIYK